jgi:hypothetical protein
VYQLSIKDLSRVYVVNIRSGEASLIPRGQVQIALTNTLAALADPAAPPGADNGNTFAYV